MEEKNLSKSVKIQAKINIHGTINKILQQQPKVALPIDFIPNDLKDWTKTLKVEVIVWLVEKYKDINGDILFSIPEKEIEDGIESDDNYGTKLKGNYLAQVIEKGLLSVGQELFFEYGTKDKNKTKFTGIVRKNGIEVDGEISSASISSLRCIQKINPTRTTSNGWTVWRTKDGKLIFELYKKLIELKQS